MCLGTLTRYLPDAENSAFKAAAPFEIRALTPHFYEAVGGVLRNYCAPRIARLLTHPAPNCARQFEGSSGLVTLHANKRRWVAVVAIDSG